MSRSIIQRPGPIGGQEITQQSPAPVSFSPWTIATQCYNDETGDYFGMEFLYNTQESALGNTAFYNGNISAIKGLRGGKPGR